MKLLYIAASPIPSNAANSVHVMKMAAALTEAGNDVTVLAPEYNRDSAADIKGDVFNWYGVKPCFTLLHSKSAKPRKLGLLIHALTGLMHGWSADLVYCRCLGSAWMCSLFGLPTVFEQHSSYHDETTPLLSRLMYMQLLKRKSLRGLVVISQALRNHIVEKTGLNTLNIIVAHDGADLMPDTPFDPPFVSDDKRPQIGYTGHLYEGRGIDIIGGIARLVPEADFHIVGGRAEDIKHWQDQFKGLSNIIFHGHVAPARVKDYIRSFDILLAPYQKKVTIMGVMDTTRWMSPLKIFEYMAAGKPILCGDIPVLHEVLENGRNAVLCTPDDPAQWADSIRDLLYNPGVAQAMADQALKDFKAHYAWTARANFILKEIETPKSHEAVP